MKKYVSLLFMLVCVTFTATSQNAEVDNYIKEGIRLYDARDFSGSIVQYQKALEIDPKSSLAHYELAMAYHAIKEYAKAVEQCDFVLAANDGSMEHAYVQKGSALDMMQNAPGAIACYKAGIAAFPKSQLMYYNLALTLYNTRNYSEAESILEQAVQLNPKHASSHLLLGFVMESQHRRVQSLLAFYNFLLLEPTGPRGALAYKALNASLKRGVERNGEKSINITIEQNGESDEFSPVDLAISMLEASKGIDENALKSEYALFTDNMRVFFGTLGELKGDKRGFWWDGYVGFFHDLRLAEHVETFSYYISQSKGDATVDSWLSDNAYKVVALTKWSSTYERKF